MAKIGSRRELLKAAAVAASAFAGRQPVVAQSRDLLTGFATRRIQTSGATIHVRTAGTGPPLLLLHGFPQTNVIWHKIAEPLSRRFTVVEFATAYFHWFFLTQPAPFPEQLIEAAPETFLRLFFRARGLRQRHSQNTCGHRASLAPCTGGAKTIARG